MPAATRPLYRPDEIEPRWQSRWRSLNLFRAGDAAGAPRRYLLEYFPYPSGAGLSVGHCRNYVPADVFCRYWRMRGCDVLHPMGWDAFGQPAENEAIRLGRHPRGMVEEYAAGYRRTLEALGCSYDWEREITSSNPDFYRHTQWLFLLLRERGLAYQDDVAINWCASCQTGLANEEVVAGACWRCHGPVVERRLRQWLFRITAYAPRLVDGLRGLDWPDGIKAAQREWIGDPASPRMRDWLVSRQRYWGCPIPIVHCPACGPVSVPEAELPVLLPDVESYQPTGDGRSPLAAIPEFVEAECPACGGPGRRETDTMAGFVCSSWYFLRYCDPHNPHAFAERSLVDRWAPVDVYMGGAEHAVAHLLYARFVTKVLYDAGLIGFEEPFTSLRNQGSMLAWTPGVETGSDAPGRGWKAVTPAEAAALGDDRVTWRWARMSKSRRNVVTPESVIEQYGADALRVSTVFAAPFADDVRYDPASAQAAHRFLARVHRLVTSSAVAQAGSEAPSDHALRQTAHRTIQAVTAAIEELRLNTAVADLMSLAAATAERARAEPGSPAVCEAVETLILLLAPFAPHLADELWTTSLGRQGLATTHAWPVADAALTAVSEHRLGVQVNGRLRAEITVPADAGDDAVRAAALDQPAVRRQLDGRRPLRVIVVPGRVVNVVLPEHGDGPGDQPVGTIPSSST
ncbi:MAG: class I tRNA ligase family protein [Gaiellales bacterium]